MSRNDHARTERDYTNTLRAIDIAREERRAIQFERMLDVAITDAYEQTDRTSDCCEMNRIGG